VCGEAENLCLQKPINAKEPHLTVPPFGGTPHKTLRQIYTLAFSLTQKNLIFNGFAQVFEEKIFLLDNSEKFNTQKT